VTPQAPQTRSTPIILQVLFVHWGNGLAGYAGIPMRFPTFRLAAPAALPLLCLLAMACSSQPPPPRAYANVTIGPTPGAAGGMCNFMSRQPFLVLGAPGQPQPMRIDDGVGPARVTCTVSSGAGGTYQVQLSAASSAPAGGRVTVLGQVDPQQGGQNVTATFAQVINGSLSSAFSSTNCTVTYSYMNGAVPLSEVPVAPGRIWAHISCPAAQNMDLMNQGTPVTCDTETDFVFENCGS